MKKFNRLKAPPHRVSRQYSSTEQVHDRKSQDLPINAVVAPAEVDDPYERGAKIVAFRNTRDDPLAGMLSRGQIDQAQFDAGRTWQRHWENCEVGGARAIDPGKPYVDGGRFPDPLDSGFSRAYAEMAKGKKLVEDKHGEFGWGLVCSILGHRRTVAQAAADRGLATEREALFLGKMFKWCLELLAELWGKKTA